MRQVVPGREVYAAHRRGARPNELAWTLPARCDRVFTNPGHWVVGEKTSPSTGEVCREESHDLGIEFRVKGGSVEAAGI